MLDKKRAEPALFSLADTPPPRQGQQDGGETPSSRGQQSGSGTGAGGVTTTFNQAPEGLVQFAVSVRVDMAELSSWRPDRIAAFFAGIAQVLAAKGDVEQKAAE